LRVGNDLFPGVCLGLLLKHYTYSSDLPRMPGWVVRTVSGILDLCQAGIAGNGITGMPECPGSHVTGGSGGILAGSVTPGLI
jgi:hypothetical protein